MPDEEVQERGREGVGMVKVWLEATTWMQFPFNAYEDKERCKAFVQKGKPKKFDLRGFHLGTKEQRRGMFVECKRYKTRGGQLKEFRRFLATAYSHHLKATELLGSCSEDFLWVTSNPFETDNWHKLRSFESIKAAIQDNLDLLEEGHEVDDDLIRDLVHRIWLLVFDEEKQVAVALTPGELKDVMTVLKREGVGLWNP